MAVALGPGRSAGSFAERLRRLRPRFASPARIRRTVDGHIRALTWVWDGWAIVWVMDIVIADGTVVSVSAAPHMTRHIGSAQPGDRAVVELVPRGGLSIARVVRIAPATEPS